MLLCRPRPLSGPACHLAILTAVTFGVVAPLACHRLLHSYFFVRRWHLNRMSEEFLARSLKEGEAALHYFRALNETQPRASGARPWLLISVITVSRRPEFHYVLQVVAQFHRLLRRCGPPCRGFQLFVCDVDDGRAGHADAELLARFVPVTSRFSERRGANGSEDAATNTFEKEKQDYVYCLERSLRGYQPEYILLVEDDAVPEEEIFRVLRHVLHARKPRLRDALYLKLYHPERLQRYVNPEPMRLLEWLGLGMLLGPALGWAYAKAARLPGPSARVVLFFSVYSMGLAELVGRHYLLELRRLTPALSNVVPTSECCTPAMLFPRAAAQRTARYLREVSCLWGFAKDTALYSFLRTKNERAYVVEPNLVRHIGMFSSLRHTYRPKLL